MSLSHFALRALLCCSPTLPLAPLHAAAPSALRFARGDIDAAVKQLEAPDQATVLAALDELAESGEPGRAALLRAAHHQSPYVASVALAKIAELGADAQPLLPDLYALVKKHGRADECSILDVLFTLMLQTQMVPAALLQPQASKGGVAAPARLDLPPEDSLRATALNALISVGSSAGDAWIELAAQEPCDGAALATCDDLRFAFAFAALDNEAFRDRLPVWLARKEPGARIAALDACGPATQPSKKNPAPEELVALVTARLTSPLAGERAHALEALGMLGAFPTAPSATITALTKDTDPLVRLHAVRALRELSKDARAGEDVLVAALSDTSPRIRAAAITWMQGDPLVGIASSLQGKAAPQPPAAALAKLVELLGDPDANVRAHAASFLGDYGVAANAALPKLEALASDAHENVRTAAERAVAEIRKASAAPADAEPKPKRVKRDGPPQLPHVPADVEATRPDDVASAEAQLDAPDQVSVLAALEKLAESGPAGLDALVRAMGHANGYVGVAATLTLGGLGRDAKSTLEALWDRALDAGWLDIAHMGEARIEFASLLPALQRATFELHTTEDGSPAPAEFDWDLGYAHRVAATHAFAAVGRHDAATMLGLYRNLSDTEGEALRSFHDLRLAAALACEADTKTWRPSVADALESTDVNVRIAALDAASCAWNKNASELPPRARAAIEKSLSAERAAERAHAIECTSAIAMQRAGVQKLLLPLLKDADPLVRLQAARVLRNYVMDVPTAEPLVVAALSDPSPRIRRAAVLSIGSLLATFETMSGEVTPPKAALPRLIELLADEDTDVVVAALQALPDYGVESQSALPAMRKLLESENGWVRGRAERAIEQLEEKLAEAKATEAK